MAKIRPIKGLDTDLENIALNKAETIIIRDEAIDKVEVLSLQEKIYSTIKRITMSLGFSVKEVQFCQRMIRECEEISKKDFPQEDLDSIEKDRQDYIAREREANKKIVAKAIELNKELANLEELKKHKSKYLTEEVLTTIDNIISEIKQFKKALEIDNIEESEIYEEIQEEKESDEFIDLEAFLGIPTQDEIQITEEDINEIEEVQETEDNAPKFDNVVDTPNVETLDISQPNPNMMNNMFDHP